MLGWGLISVASLVLVVHVPGFGEEDTAVLELDVLPRHGRLVRIFKTDVPVVLFNPGVSQAICLLCVHLITFTWNHP
jgi:hypothetical protein